MNTLMLKTSVLLIAALTDGAALAQPTPAQTDAIKASCRTDYMKSCMSVPPGGQAAFDCLKRNIATLSPACQTAVNAISPPAAPKPTAVTPAAPAPTPATQTSTAVTPPPAPPLAPAPTVAVAPATGPVVTPAPVATAPAARPAPAPKPVAAVAPAAAAIATPPTAAQQNAIRQSCRNDFMANCSGVQPGGKDALVCLQTHAARLSPPCRQAVSAIGGAPKSAATAAAVAVAPAATATSAVAPAMPTPEQQAAIKNTCRADFMRNCRGVQSGGPEALICLQTNSARLSPNCQTSVAAIADSIPATTAAAAATPAAVAAAPAAKRTYLTPGIHPAVRIGRKIRERIEQ